KRLVTYVVRQPEHHGLGDPATYDGTCFPDLVGARRLDGFDSNAWREHLPRETLDPVWSAAGLAAPSGVALDGFALAALVHAAGRAVAADPSLADNEAPTVRARRVAVVLAAEAGFATERVADVLGCTGR